MTVCIVARCTENDSFIAASDRMFSYGNQYTYESISLKRIGLTPDGRWHTMFAANYVPNVLPVIRGSRHVLNGRGKRPPFDLDTVERACVQAYQVQRARLVSDTILSKYGFDLTSYKHEVTKFGPAECARINGEIEQLKVGVELIVYGYDEWNVAHLFQGGRTRSLDLLRSRRICRSRIGGWLGASITPVRRASQNLTG